ncbi:MAG: ATP phosphoribosyltransferase regulatory subunit [Bacillaceae bacterium]
MREELSGLLWRYEMKHKMEKYAIERGYVPIQPPLFQEYETFQCENTSLTKEQMVVVMNGQQQLYVLRPDITSNILKMVLPHYREGEEIKLCYQSTVYRSKSYGIKELPQFGIEYLGDTNGTSEREVLEMAVDLLKDVPFLIEVSHCGFLNGLFQELSLSNEEKKQLKRLLYTKNRDELCLIGEQLHVNKEIQDLFAHFFTLHGTVGEVVNKASRYLFNKEMEEAVNKLAQLKDISEHVIVDVSMINELDYYNGLIFKGYHQGLHKEVLSGGRYDVKGTPFGKEIGAIGFSIDTNAWIRVREGEAVWKA